MPKTKETLHAKEYSFIYETKFDKLQKTIKESSNFLFFALSFLMVFLLGIEYPIIAGMLLLFFTTLIKLNNATVTEKVEPILDVGLHFHQSEDYLVHIGNAVSSIEDVFDPATVLNPKKSRKDGFNPEAVKYPILVSDKMLLTHMFVIGTTGAGKTTFLTNILQQILILGGGCLAVDGKGDQSVYEAFWNTAVHCGREDDFMVINFNIPDESNTMNPLLKGSADEITDIIGNMLDTGGDNSFWSGRALAMMKGLLSILVPLRDNGLMFDPTGKKVDVLTFSFLGKWIDMQNLKMLYFTIKEANKGVDGVMRLPEKILGTPQGLEIPLKFTSEAYNNIYHYKLGKKEAGIDISRLEQYLSSVYLNIYNPEANIEEGTSKQHGNSFLMWNESLDLIAGRFGMIFDTAEPEIDMQDVVSNGRIVYILLPSLKVDTRTLSVLGKLILGFFKQAISVLLGNKISGTIEQRYRSFAIRPRVPFWGVMDEYGAYAVEGFDNVLAQARSLRVSIAILVQEIASIKKGSELEAQRLLGNTGIKIILKLEEQESIKQVIDFLSKKEVATVQVSEVTDGILDRKLQTSEKDLLTTTMLKKMTGGHAYFMWAGEVVPCLVRYYEQPISKRIPEFKNFKESIIPFYKINYLIEDLKKENIEIVNNDINLEAQIFIMNEIYGTQLRKFNSEINDTLEQIKDIKNIDLNELTNNNNDILNKLMAIQQKF